MKHSLTAVLLALSTSVAAASRMSVDALPEPVRPLAEVETNVAFSVGMPGDNLWRLSIELDASTSNCVEVVIGTDADGDGALGIDEGEFSVGWSCGEWFWRDRRGGGTGRVAGAEVARRLDWTLRLTEEKTARSVVGNVFSGVVDPTCFNPAWNMIRVVSRGTVSLRVESKVTVDALKLRVR
ncbi:MAG: hypothetical protein II863_03485 [Kiritimatiellae bacterium]|nr:hypothetical protein [Kiritimatiellia bacterium]